MKLSRIYCVCLVVLFVIATAFSMPSGTEQREIENEDVITEKRPFDFSDEFYEKNGIRPSLIIDRRTGIDRYSVVDFNDSDDYRNVRIIGTQSAYDSDGRTHYRSKLGELFKDAFLENKNGRKAYELANRFPIFNFPSTTHENSDRQAVIVETGDGYFEKNPLGLGVVVLVEYTERIRTKEGQEVLEKLTRRNGLTLDGTPMIRTVQEIRDLTRRGLVTQKIRGVDDERVPSITINKVFRDPTMGTISPDAFLEMVLKDNGKPLDDEKFFVDEFGCLQRTGKWCRAE